MTRRHLRNTASLPGGPVASAPVPDGRTATKARHPSLPATARKTAAKPKKAKPEAAPLVAYKGFTKDLTCQGYQFELGKSFTHDGPVKACSSGFHACEAPFDVWSYYDFGTGNRYCRVHLTGKTDRHEGDSKIAAETIFVETEITLGEMIRAGVKYEIDGAFAKAKSDKDSNASSGHYATNASSGNYATNASSGDSATNASSGHYATNASSGNSARNASSGNSATNASSGNYATNASSGNYATNASSGNSATNASSGNSATNASSGDSATNASSGNSATNASSGNSATNASSGHCATNASSGNYATNASSGNSATNAATGEKSVIAAAGLCSLAKGAKGTAIALPYTDAKGQIRFVCGVAGEKGCPADTWLKADNGKLVPA